MKTVTLEIDGALYALKPGDTLDLDTPIFDGHGRKVGTVQTAIRVESIAEVAHPDVN